MESMLNVVYEDWIKKCGDDEKEQLRIEAREWKKRDRELRKVWGEVAKATDTADFAS